MRVKTLMKVDGVILLPKGPGLDVMMDEEKVAQYRADV